MSFSPLTLSRNVYPVIGDKVSVNTTRGKHFIDFDQTVSTLETLGDSQTAKTDPSSSEFYRNIIDTLTSLNNEIVTSDKLTERFMVEPEKVNVHDVMIALQKSKMNLDLTRTVIQKAIEGYNTIINLR